jgi:hypothetical protein
MPVHITPHACYDTIVYINITIIISDTRAVLLFFFLFFLVYLRVPVSRGKVLELDYIRAVMSLRLCSTNRQLQVNWYLW